ncbi:MAG: GvpL/GvpF family gas vesicle protein [Oscillochloridaceae bacterium]|nr:GvpL/GvpF family gas vesicle protein [Chloroflexaceae bacterium]MDW8388687.1 GvpL/GvpF family gas vesicle protein [Oscillochloridaceae bacterium]
MPVTEPTDPGLEQQGYYVYGITDGAPEGLAPGVEPGGPVELLVDGDLVAIVSPVSLAAFTAEAMRACQDDLAWIETRVRAHQAVLARAMRQATVVPLRFGTVFRDAAGVRAMLLEHAPRFREALARLAGRQEWGLKISVDEARLTAQVVAASVRIQDIDARQRGLRAGAAYMLAKQREQILREEVARAIETCARDAHARLAAEAVATVIDSPAPAGAPSDEQPVFRCAYLVDIANLETFLATLDCLAATHPAFTFTLSGPWPAYNFVSQPTELAHA